MRRKKLNTNHNTLYKKINLSNNKNPFENLISFNTDNEFDEDFYEKFVEPFYTIRIINLPDFKSDYIKIKSEINSDVVKKIIGENNWKERIVGAFFCAIENLTEFEDIIGIHFLKSDLVHQGKGFALALASFSSKKSIDYLKKYLDYYLTRKDLFYEQNYAMSALKWIDTTTKSEHTKEYKQKYDEWEKDSSRKFDSYYDEFIQQMLIIEELKTAGNNSNRCTTPKKL